MAVALIILAMSLVETKARGNNGLTLGFFDEGKKFELSLLTEISEREILKLYIYILVVWSSRACSQSDRTIAIAVRRRKNYNHLEHMLLVRFCKSDVHDITIETF